MQRFAATLGLAGLTVGVLACHLVGGLDGLEYSDRGTGGGAASGVTTSGTGTAAGAGGRGGTAGAGGETTTTSTSGGGGQAGQAGAGGSPSTVCFPSGLSDGFDGTSINPTLWSVSADVGVTVGAGGGVAYFEPPSNSATGLSGRVQSQQTYDFTGCGVWVELVSILNSGVTGYAILEMRVDEANEGEIIANTDGNITFTLETASVTAPGDVAIPYDSTAHRWLRLREAGGTFFEETSPDGLVWTVQYSYDTPAWITGAYVRFGIRTDATTASPGRAEFDNLNTSS